MSKTHFLLYAYLTSKHELNMNLTIIPEILAKYGISEQFKEFDNNDKDIIHLPRQQVAILKEWLKIRGCGSLREDFYTRFIPIFKEFGAVTWSVK